ncbi:endonuclease/exonuclease/phosphatase family protein [Piscinibacter sakaiensis]|uniref:endonuclease/exonuclease/phosphatase family protein n=1 Tax=Piscinibacter sakaiensis TaxID=1547922 RepID=UPI003AAD65CB
MHLITWNIQWGRGADGQVDLERIVADARALADFDVLCLQEVSAGHDNLPGCDGADQFEQLARLLPDYQAVCGIASDLSGPQGRRRRFGNMMLSRLPVRQVFRHLLPWPADDALRSMQRMALEATIETPAGPLRVTTTHLEYYSARQRRAQIERLLALHAEAVAQARCSRPGDAADGPFENLPRAAASVLVGDCNFRPDDPEHGWMCAPIDLQTPPYRDAWQLCHPGEPHPPTVGIHDKQQWPGPPFCCDFAFVSQELTRQVRDVRVDAGTAASDHQPLVIELD